MKIISPSILSADFTDLYSDISVFEGVQNVWLHLDVMDAHFVPNLTFGPPIIRQLSKKTTIPLDCHLMVSDPMFYIDELKEANLHNVTFHFESTSDPLSVLLSYRKHFSHVGISIKPNTPVSSLGHDILSKIDLVLVMSVEPGFGGQSFIPNSIDKISELNKIREDNNYNFLIQVDGGVSNKNASTLWNAGADNLVAGSYIFNNNQSDYLSAVDSLL